MTIQITPRFGLSVWDSDGDQITRQMFSANFEATEALGAICTSGPLSSRPAAGVGRAFYFATDMNQMFFDTGAAWEPVLLAPDTVYTASGRPAAGTSGRYVWESDASRLFRDNGSQYVEVLTSTVMPAGLIMPSVIASVPPGWLFCDGTAYSPGAFPDLYAAIGTRYGAQGGQFRVPDFRGFLLTGGSAPGSVGSGTFGAHTHPGHNHGVTTTVPFVDHVHGYHQPSASGGDTVTGTAQVPVTLAALGGTSEAEAATTSTDADGQSAALASYQNVAWLIKASGGPHD